MNARDHAKAASTELWHGLEQAASHLVVATHDLPPSSAQCRLASACREAERDAQRYSQHLNINTLIILAVHLHSVASALPALYDLLDDTVTDTRKEAHANEAARNQSTAHAETGYAAPDRPTTRRE